LSEESLPAAEIGRKREISRCQGGKGGEIDMAVPTEGFQKEKKKKRRQLHFKEERGNDTYLDALAREKGKGDVFGLRGGWRWRSLTPLNEKEKRKEKGASPAQSLLPGKKKRQPSLAAKRQRKAKGPSLTGHKKGCSTEKYIKSEKERRKKTIAHPLAKNKRNLLSLPHMEGRET